MPDELQHMVTNVAPHDTADLEMAFNKYYKADEFENCIHAIIGPAREAGTRCLRNWQRAGDTRPAETQI